MKEVERLDKENEELETRIGENGDFITSHVQVCDATIVNCRPTRRRNS